MAGTLVSDFSIGDSNIDNVMLTLDKAYKSFQAFFYTDLNVQYSEDPADCK